MTLGSNNQLSNLNELFVVSKTAPQAISISMGTFLSQGGYAELR